MAIFTQDELEGFRRSLLPQQQTPTVQPAKKKGGRGGTLTSLISEGGALGGAAAGAAAGSVVPIIGTALGGILGGAAGAFGGRLAENKVRDDRLGVGDAAKEAALTGVLGAPIRALKYGGTAIANSKGGLQAALKAGAQTADAPGVIGRTLGNASNRAADNAYTKAIGSSKKAKNDFAAQYGDKLGTVARRYGITDETTARAAITPLQSEFDQAFKGVQVGKKDLNDVLGNLYKPYLKGIDIKERGLGKDLQSQVKEILGKYKAKDAVDLDDIVSLRKQFDKKITKYKTDDSARGFYQTMSDGLREIIRGFGDQQGLRTASGRTVRDAGKELSPLYKILDETVKNAEGPGGTSTLGFRNLLGGNLFGGAAGGGPIGATLGFGTAAALNSDAGRQATARGLNAITPKPSTNTIGDALRGSSRAGRAQLAEGVLNQPQSSESNSSDMNAMNANIASPVSINAITNELSQTPEGSSSPFAPENVEANIQNILASGGSMKDVSEYLSVAKTVQSLSQVQKPKPLNQFQQERADLMTALDNTEGAVNAGSINFGPIGSRIEGVKSVFNAADPETLAYKNTISGLRAAITKARAGASLTEGELRLLKQYTPTDTDSEQVVRSKLTQLRKLYGYNAPTGGGVDTQSLISALGGAMQ